MPLSDAQRGLWYLHRLAGPDPAYNVPLVLRFPSGVDRAALRAALVDVVTRHEPLRTVVREADGEPCQVVLRPDQAAPDLPVTATDEDRLTGLLARRGPVRVRPGRSRPDPGPAVRPAGRCRRAPVAAAPHRRRRPVARSAGP
nr:hypothetical protein GCM10020092_038140 [Actinoplanes digitatis]